MVQEAENRSDIKGTIAAKKAEWKARYGSMDGFDKAYPQYSGSADISGELTVDDIKQIQKKIRAYLDSYEDTADGNMDVEFLEMLRDALVSDIEERIAVVQKMQDDASRMAVKGFRK